MSEFRLHHIGYLVEDIEAARQYWIDTYGFAADGDIIHDAGQQARVCLLRQSAADHWVELISPDSEESHLHRALQRKVNLHHVAYAVDDLSAAIKDLRAAGGLPLSKPVVGAAFEREIMWFQDPIQGLVELIAPGDGPYQLD